MIKRENRPYLIVGLLAAALIAAIVATSVTTIRRAQEINRQQADNAAWMAFQFEYELTRMRLALAEARLGRIDDTGLRLRWEILVSRVEPLQSGGVGEVFQAQEFFRENFTFLSSRIGEIDRLLAARDGRLLSLLDELEPLVADMAPPARELSIKVIGFWQSYIAAQRADLAGRLRLAVAGAIALFSLLVAALIVLLRQRNRMRQTAQELASARFQAELASRAKTDFLAHMSHEFRTPLNAIIGFSDVMATETFGPVENPRYKEYVGHIVSAGRYLLDLINSVLDVAKIESGKIETKPERVSLDEVRPLVLDMVRNRASTKRIRISLAIEEKLPAFSFDPRHLRQILINLLINAVKFTPEDGQIELGARRIGPALEIWVKDSGIGIAEHDIAKLLQPFGQVASAQQTQSGTGLGLYISKALAEHNDSRLSLESAPGKGTKVTLTVPFAFSATQPKNAAAVSR